MPAIFAPPISAVVLPSCILLAVSCPMMPAAEPVNLVTNGGFEDGTDQAITGWVINNWAKNAAEYALDATRPGQGSRSLRMRLIKASNADNIELYQFLPAVNPGDVLRVSMWVRGPDNSRPLEVTLNRQSPPWGGDGEYARFPIRFGETWSRQSTIVRLPPQYQPKDCVINIHLHQEIPVWIDAVEIVRLPTVSEEPAVPGNRVPNGSFEVGTSGWTCTPPWWPEGSSYQPFLTGAADAWELEAPVIADAPHGRHALRFRVDGMMRQAHLSSPWFPLRYGHPAEVGFHVRGPAGGKLDCWLSHGKPGQEIRIDHQVVATGTWQTVEFSVVPAASAYGTYFLGMNTWSAGDWLIDHVQVAEPALGDAPQTTTVALEPANLLPVGNLVDPGAEVRWRIRATGAAATTLSLMVRAVDLHGRTRGRWPLTLDLGRDGSASAEVGPIPTDRLGPVKLEVHLAEADPATRPLADAQFQVLPKLPPLGQVQDRFFGGHAFTLGARELAVAERVGIRSLRFCESTKWCFAEPEQKGRFDLTDAVAAFDRVRAQGFTILATLGYNPEWAVDLRDQPTRTWMRYCHVVPKNWADWRDYVATVAATVGDRVEAYELLNEPDLDDFMTVPKDYPGGRAALYTRYATETRAALAKVRPATRLIGPVFFSPGSPFVSTFLETGETRQFDALSFHYYGVVPLTQRSFVDRLRAAPHGDQGLWMSEGAYAVNVQTWLRAPGLPTATPEAMPGLVAGTARQLVLWKALGIARHFQYPGPRKWSGGMLINDQDWKFGDDIFGNPLPLWSAHAAAVLLLEGAAPLVQEPISELDLGGIQVVVCRFRRQPQTITVAWAMAPVEVAALPAAVLPREANVYDVLGNPIPLPKQLGPEPVYLVR